MKDRRAPFHRYCAFIPLILSLVFLAPLLSNGQEAVQSSCVQCHLDLGGEFAEPVLELRESAHMEKEVACQDCHGGDPTAEDMDAAMSPDKGFRGAPGRVEIPEFCARCHADPAMMKQYNLRTDQLAEYKTSQHGKLLYEKGDKNVAVCTDCHGVHDIKSKDDPRSSVFKTNIPGTCADCHSNDKLMEPYGIPTNQYDLYVESVHGKRLLVKKDLGAPACADCHGIHGASPPGFAEIANVCSYCHGKIAEYFKQSPHYTGREQKTGARCINCHGNHDIRRGITALYVGSDPGHCGACHPQNSQPLSLAQHLKEKIELAIEKVSRAREGLESVEDSGKNLAHIQETFESARSALVQSRALAHTLSHEKIDDKVSTVVQSTDKVLEDVRQIKREIKSRKASVIIVLLILGALMALLIVKLKSFSRE